MAEFRPPVIPLASPGVPIIVSGWLGRNDYWLLNENQIVASPQVFRWIVLFSLADRWPVRDLVAPGEDG